MILKAVAGTGTVPEPASVRLLSARAPFGLSSGSKTSRGEIRSKPEYLQSETGSETGSGAGTVPVPVRIPNF